MVSNIMKKKDKNQKLVQSEVKYRALMSIVGEKWSTNIKSDILEYAKSLTLGE
jgi:hypothetical protein